MKGLVHEKVRFFRFIFCGCGYSKYDSRNRIGQASLSHWILRLSVILDSAPQTINCWLELLAEQNSATHKFTIIFPLSM